MRIAFWLLKYLIVTTLFLSCNNFDTREWKNNRSIRQKQSKDLISSKILIGKNYLEVIALLGAEDINSNINNQVYNNYDFKIEYIVGGCNMIDFEKVIIEFKKSKVIRVIKGCD